MLPFKKKTAVRRSYYTLLLIWFYGISAFLSIGIQRLWRYLPENNPEVLRQGLLVGIPQRAM